MSPKITTRDVSGLAKAGVTSALKAVPEVGSILAAGVGALWSVLEGIFADESDIFEDLRERIAELVDQKIEANVLETFSKTLNGHRLQVVKYLGYVKLGDQGYESAKHLNLSVQSDFLTTLEELSADSHRVVLLPLYAQTANLYLGLCRDRVIQADAWSLTADERKLAVENLEQEIARRIKTMRRSYELGLESKRKAAAGLAPRRRFEEVNAYIRTMTLDALDFAALWEHFPPDRYPEGTIVRDRREIYSDVYGQYSSADFAMPETPPTAPMKSLTCWEEKGDNRRHLFAAEATYTTDAGPDGATSTGLMGRRDRAVLEYPDRRRAIKTTISLEEALILAVELRCGVIIDGVRFRGSHRREPFETPLIGGPTGEPHEIAFPGHCLSSIRILGTDNSNDGAASGVVFGFKWIDAFEETERLDLELPLLDLTPPIGGFPLHDLIQVVSEDLADG